MRLLKKSHMDDLSYPKPDLSSSDKASNRAFGLLFIAVFIDLLGFGIIIPVLPYLTQYFDVNKYGGEYVAYGWILAIYSLVQFIFAPIWGRISDKIGRRKIILIGLGGSFISFTIFGLVKSFPLILFSRGLAGFFTGASLPTSRAYVADITPPEKRAMRFGLLGAAFGLGFTFGPVIGGFVSLITINPLGIQASPSFFSAIITLLNFLAATKFLPESKDVVKSDIKIISERKNPIKEFLKFFRIEGVTLLILSFGITTFVFSAFETNFQIFAIVIDKTIKPFGIGLIFGLIGIVGIIVQGGLIGPVVDKLGDELTLKIGLLFLILGFFGLIYVKTILYLVIFCIPLAIGASLVNPTINSSLSNRIPLSQQGGGLGINSSVSALGRIFGPLIGTFIFEKYGPYEPFKWSVYIMIPLTIVVVLFIKSIKK